MLRVAAGVRGVIGRASGARSTGRGATASAGARGADAVSGQAVNPDMACLGNL